jgi:hypothetical protein
MPELLLPWDDDWDCIGKPEDVWELDDLMQ